MVFPKMEREPVCELKVKGTQVTSERSLPVTSRSLKLVASQETTLVELESAPPLKMFPTMWMPVMLAEPVMRMALPAFGTRRLSDWMERLEEAEEPPTVMSWACACGGLLVSQKDWMMLFVPAPRSFTFDPERVRVSLT